MCEVDMSAFFPHQLNIWGTESGVLLCKEMEAMTSW